MAKFLKILSRCLTGDRPQQELVEFLADYLDGELPDRTRSDFERHLARCPQCMEYLASYRETVRLGRLAYDLDGPLPKGVPEELVEAILSSRRST